LGNDSLWTDEFFSLELSAGRGLGDALIPQDVLVAQPPSPTLLSGAPPWYRTWTAMSDDTHPPLHPLALRCWRFVFGQGAIAARSLSVAFSLLAIVFVFIAVAALHGSASALGAALVMAVAAPQIEFAQFVRDYAMLVMAVAACCAAAARIAQRGATAINCLLISTAMLMAMLIHYAAAGPLVGIAIFLICRLDRRERIRILLAIAMSALIYLAIWGPYLLDQRDNFTSNMLWTIEGADGHAARTLWRLLRLPLRFLFEPKVSGDLIASASAIFYVLPLLFVRRSSGWLLWWLVLVGAVVPVLISDLLRSSFLLNMPRYTIAGSIAIYAMIGALSSIAPETAPRMIKLTFRAIPALVALACALTLPEFYQRRQPDFRQMAQYLNARTDPAKDVVLIIVPASSIWTGYVLQLAISHYSVGPQCPTAILSRPPDDAMMQQILARGGRVWIVGTHGLAAFPHAVVQESNYFHGVATVWGLKLAHSTTSHATTSKAQTSHAPTSQAPTSQSVISR
jgi:uncharacterized membrane protein